MENTKDLWMGVSPPSRRKNKNMKRFIFAIAIFLMSSIIGYIKGQDSGKISQGGNPIVKVTGNDSVCGGIHRYQATIENPFSTYTYNWEASGGSVFGSANGSTCDIYWDPTTTVVSGTVKVKVTDAGSNETNAQLTVMVFPTVIPTLSGNINSNPGIPTPYGTDENQSDYFWIIDGGYIQSGQGTSSVIIVWTAIGTHFISTSYQTPSGCTATKEITVRVWGVGLEDVDKKPPVVFPNPVKDLLVVEFENSGQSLKTVLLYDLFGRERIRLTTMENRLQLNVSGLLPGIYALKAEDGELLYHKTIIKY
jgi:hypothetical protein